MTYFFCLRPHLPGRRLGVESQDENPTVDRQLTELRDELHVLRPHARPPPNQCRPSQLVASAKEMIYYLGT